MNRIFFIESLVVARPSALTEEDCVRASVIKEGEMGWAAEYRFEGAEISMAEAKNICLGCTNRGGIVDF
jgi:hypothetical protein